MRKGEPLAWLHANDEKKAAEAEKRFLAAYDFTQEPVGKSDLIKKIIPFRNGAVDREKG